jgi:uncharacterized protein YbjT (DUF2867 family)
MSSPSVLVMGASGSVGRLIVESGLARGYAMTGLVRTASEPFSPEVRIVVGDALDPDPVDRAVADQQRSPTRSERGHWDRPHSSPSRRAY